MAQFQTIAVFFALSTFSAHAATIDGTLPGLLTFASVTVPDNPTGAMVQPIVSQQNYDQTFTFTVSGGTGTGLLFLQVDLEAHPYNGSDFGYEHLSSCSDLGMLPFYPHLQTLPTEPGGCNPAGGNFGFNITFGQPLDIRFVADSFAAYSFATQIPGLLPGLRGGYQIESSVNIYGVFVLDSQLHSVPDAVVSIVDPDPVPEPSTPALAISGLVALTALCRRSTRRQRS